MHRPTTRPTAEGRDGGSTDRAMNVLQYATALLAIAAVILLASLR